MALSFRDRIKPGRFTVPRVNRYGSLRRLAANLGVLVRSNEFMLIPVALIVGVAGGAVVTLMSHLAQLAHVLIFGIPIDAKLSGNAAISPAAALIAPAAGGLLLGV